MQLTPQLVDLRLKLLNISFIANDNASGALIGSDLLLREPVACVGLERAAVLHGERPASAGAGNEARNLARLRRHDHHNAVEAVAPGIFAGVLRRKNQRRLDDHHRIRLRTRDLGNLLRLYR